jgi:hypothetical protein
MTKMVEISAKKLNIIVKARCAIKAARAIAFEVDVQDRMMAEFCLLWLVYIVLQYMKEHKGRNLVHLPAILEIVQTDIRTHDCF